MSDDPEQRERSFHENGLLVIGFLGGFTLAALTLVLTAKSTIEAGIPDSGMIFSMTIPDAYFALLVAMLGILSFLCVWTSLLMLFLSADKEPTKRKHQRAFVRNSIAIIAGSFTTLLVLLVYPFSVPAAVALIAVTPLVGSLARLSSYRDLSGKSDQKT